MSWTGDLHDPDFAKGSCSQRKKGPGVMSLVCKLGSAIY